MHGNRDAHPTPARAAPQRALLRAGAGHPAWAWRGRRALADTLKALGDPTRLRMLDLLAQQPEPLCVCDITPQFAQNQPTISHHLRILREAGLIETEKRGIWAYYWATRWEGDAVRRRGARLARPFFTHTH